MKFIPIDINNWQRKEYFEHYHNIVPCTYCMTVKLDITNLKTKNNHLYSTLLFSLTQLINRHQEFRTCFNSEGVLGFFDEMIPSYTVFNPDTETFTCLWTSETKDYDTFYQAYKKDVETFGKNQGLVGKPNIPDNVFNVSMLPWISFDAFNLNLQKGYNYLLPIFTFGKFYKENNKYYLPLSIQVHHGVCDGFHICRLVNELQKMLLL